MLQLLRRLFARSTSRSAPEPRPLPPPDAEAWCAARASELRASHGAAIPVTPADVRRARFGAERGFFCLHQWPGGAELRPVDWWPGRGAPKGSQTIRTIAGMPAQV